MRDIFIFAVVFGLLPLCIIRPVVGVLAWSWLGYMNPHKLSWGAAYNFPFAQLVAIATIIGIFSLYAGKKNKPTFPNNPKTTALMLLWIFFTISTIFALEPDSAWPAWEQITKTLLMTLFTLLLIDDAKKLKYLVLVIAFSVGFYGLKGGIFSILTGGNYLVWGPPEGMIKENNAIGVALNMILPMLFYLSVMEENKWVYRLLRITFYLSIVAVIFTYSRGAMLGLIVTLGLIMLRTKPLYLIYIVILTIFTLPIAFNSLPQRWQDKMVTIFEYEADASAVSRMEAWEAAWNLALDRPLLGGGFNAINNKQIYDKYHGGNLKDIAGNHKTGAHSIYFETIGENGFPGIILFVFLIFSTILGMRKIRRQHRHTPQSPPYCYASMIEIGIIAYAVSGAFLELASFDLFYHFVAIGIIIQATLYAKNKMKGEKQSAGATQPDFALQTETQIK